MSLQVVVSDAFKLPDGLAEDVEAPGPLAILRIWKLDLVLDVVCCNGFIAERAQLSRTFPAPDLSGHLARQDPLRDAFAGDRP